MVLNKKIAIRRAEVSDILMMQEFIFKHGQNPWNFLPENEVKVHLLEIKTKKVKAFVATDSQYLVGFVTVFLGIPDSCQKYEPTNTDEVAYLSEIVVHRNYTGYGIGSMLINQLKQYLISNGIKRVYAERHVENIASAKVMEKNGFRVIEEYYDPKRRLSGLQKTAITRLDL